MRVRGPGSFKPAYPIPFVSKLKLVPKTYPKNYFASYKMKPYKKSYYTNNKRTRKKAATKIQALFRGKRLRNFFFKK